MIHDTYAGFDVEVRADGICVVTLNKPEQMNGLNRALKRDLTDLTVQLAYSNKVRAVVLTGGAHFSAGDNITPGAQDNWEEARTQPVKRDDSVSISTYSALRSVSQSVTKAWRDMDLITIAAMDGYAIQSGLSLALACDFRIATRRAKLGSATLRMGYLPDEGGHHLLVQYLGVPKAKDFMLRKRIVGGEEALALGLVNEVCEPDELMPKAMALAAEMAEGPQVAMRLLKNSIDLAGSLTFEQSCMDIAVRTAISDHHPDAKEGPAAFKARPRRKPNYNQA
jgi:2-(1,2-epoxy-1,2-dihydrophenyl)acetyl-CoA isomerase